MIILRNKIKEEFIVKRTELLNKLNNLKIIVVHKPDYNNMTNEQLEIRIKLLKTMSKRGIEASKR